jgi:hypothetical protein
VQNESVIATRTARSAALLDAQAAVVEEAGERGPALEAVVDRLGGLAPPGELGMLLAQPGLQAPQICLVETSPGLTKKVSGHCISLSALAPHPKFGPWRPR